MELTTPFSTEQNSTITVNSLNQFFKSELGKNTVQQLRKIIYLMIFC